MCNINDEKKLAALEAVKEIEEGMIVGLGTGSTAFYAIHAVGEMVKNGAEIRAVATSEETRQLALQLGISIIDINAIDKIDVTIDGADEFTQNMDLIKGGGGALLREKIVASITEKEIIIADSSKLVHDLGMFKVPLEVIPFAYASVMRKLNSIGGIGVVRTKNGINFITDQGNIIIDADFGIINTPGDLAKKLDEIVGVVEHGLFVGLAHKVIMGKGEETMAFTRS